MMIHKIHRKNMLNKSIAWGLKHIIGICCVNISGHMSSVRQKLAYCKRRSKGSLYNPAKTDGWDYIKILIMLEKTLRSLKTKNDTESALSQVR